MKMNAGMQVMGFIIILFLILYLYKYLNSNVELPIYIQENDVKQSRPINTINVEKKPIDDTINMSANDLQIVHNKFNMYEEDQTINTFGFENELVNNNKNKSFAPELNELFEDLKMDSDSELEYDVEYIKEQKSDLPIADVPVYLLNQNGPLRLSEKPKA